MNIQTKESDLSTPWNKGKLVGQKAPLRISEIWAIRIRLEIYGRARDLALFNLAIDSKLRGCDLVQIRVQNFLFRKPRFPIIIDTGNGLLGAKSWAVCEKRLATITFPDMAPRDVIDSTAEAFSWYPEHMAFSPLTFKKRWTTVAIIELYNGSKGPGRPEYPTTSLGNKSLEKVVKDIVELLAAP